MGLSVGFLSITLTAPLLPTVSVESKVKKDDASGSEKPAEVSIKAFDAITTSVDFSFSHTYLLIDILPELEGSEEQTAPAQPAHSPVSKVLRILFSRIISPNAP